MTGPGETTGASEVDPVVLAGEPDSAAQLERGDDDLAPLRGAGDLPPLGGAEDGPPLRRDAEREQPAGSGEWAAADALLEGQPTELGE